MVTGSRMSITRIYSRHVHRVSKSSKRN